jgi:hypothetical protein
LFKGELQGGFSAALLLFCSIFPFTLHASRFTVFFHASRLHGFFTAGAIPALIKKQEVL